MSDWPVVNVYAQESPHAPTMIACNREGLEKLLKMIATLVAEGGSGCIPISASDGEWYVLGVVVSEAVGEFTDHYEENDEASGERVLHGGGSVEWWERTMRWLVDMQHRIWPVGGGKDLTRPPSEER